MTTEDRKCAQVCECGHAKERHWMHFFGPGTCTVSVDVRHPATGGGGLKPCPCKGYVPAFSEYTELEGTLADGLD